MPGREYLRVEIIPRDFPISGRLVGGHHEHRRDLDVDADEIQRRTDDLHLIVGELWRVPARRLQVGVVVLTLQHRHKEVAVQIPGGCLRGFDVFGRARGIPFRSALAPEPPLGWRAVILGRLPCKRDSPRHSQRGPQLPLANVTAQWNFEQRLILARARFRADAFSGRLSRARFGHALEESTNGRCISRISSGRDLPIKGAACMSRFQGLAHYGA